MKPQAMVTMFEALGEWRRGGVDIGEAIKAVDAYAEAYTAELLNREPSVSAEECAKFIIIRCEELDRLQGAISRVVYIPIDEPDAKAALEMAIDAVADGHMTSPTAEAAKMMAPKAAVYEVRLGSYQDEVRLPL